MWFLITSAQGNLAMRPILPGEEGQALDVIVTVIQQEFFDGVYTFEQIKGYQVGTGAFKDILSISATYCDNNGIFLVLVDNGTVVGTGAIRKLTDDICELARLWFLKEYRGKGLGKKMTAQLLEFAKNHGYTKVRLDVYRPEIQTHAVALYKKLGFYEIERYNAADAELFMEKIL
jgi:putative acetyltransferase